MNDITRLNRADAVAALRAALGQLTGAKTQRRAAALADAVEAEAHDGPRFPTATALAVFEGAPDPDDSFKEFRREFGQQVKKAGGDTTLWLDGAGHARAWGVSSPSFDRAQTTKEAVTKHSEGAVPAETIDAGARGVSIKDSQPEYLVYVDLAPGQARAVELLEELDKLARVDRHLRCRIIRPPRTAAERQTMARTSLIKSAQVVVVGLSTDYLSEYPIAEADRGWWTSGSVLPVVLDDLSDRAEEYTFGVPVVKPEGTPFVRRRGPERRAQLVREVWAAVVHLLSAGELRDPSRDDPADPSPALGERPFEATADLGRPNRAQPAEGPDDDVEAVRAGDRTAVGSLLASGIPLDPDIGLADGHVPGERVAIQMARPKRLGERSAPQASGEEGAATDGGYVQPMLDEWLQRPLVSAEWLRRDRAENPSSVEPDPGSPETQREDSGARPFLMLLGEYGMGKTTACQLLTHRLLEQRGQGAAARVPIYLDLRRLGPAGRADPDLRTILAEVVSRAWEADGTRPPTPEEIVELVREHGAVILFDGLDEVLNHLDEERGQRFIAELWRILPPRVLLDPDQRDRCGRVVMSCRTHIFRSLAEQSAFLLGGGREQVGERYYEAIQLLPFGEEQIRRFFENNIVEATSSTVERAWQSLGEIHNLRELAERPVSLRMLTAQLADIERLRLLGHSVGAVDLYDGLVESWLLRDKKKHKIPERLKPWLMEELAIELWARSERTMDADELEDWFEGRLDDDSRFARAVARLPEAERHPQVLAEDLRNATVVVRQEADRFEFAHTSLLEYFVARRLARTVSDMTDGGDPNLGPWSTPNLSDETLGFLVELLEQSDTKKTDVLLRHVGSSYRPGVSELVVEVLAKWVERFPDSAHTLTLDGWDLRGGRVEGLQLGTPRRAISAKRTDFRGASLIRCFFRHVDLSNSSWDEAQVASTELWDCRLTGATWRDTAATVTNFRRCDDPPNLVGSTQLPVPHTEPTSEGRWAIVGPSMRGVLSVGWSPDGTRLVSGSDDGTIRIWDPDDGTELGRLEGHTGGVRSVGWSPDGTRLVSGSTDGTIRVWDPNGRTELGRLEGHTGGVWSVGWSPDGTRLVSGSNDGTIRVWDPDERTELGRLEGHTDWVRSVGWSPDGTRLVSGSNDGTIRIWDPDERTELGRLEGHTNTVWSVGWSPDGTRLVSGSNDGTIRIWDPNERTELGRLEGHTDWVRSVGWSPDGTRLVSGSNDGTIRIWDPDERTELGRLEGHTDWVRSVGWSPDGTRLVSGSNDGTIRIWDPNERTELGRLEGHTNTVWSVGWSPDGTRLVSGSNDGTIRIWDPNERTELGRLEGHTDWVWSVGWSPDGTRLVSGSTDGTIRIWDPNERTELGRLEGHTGGVWSVGWSPDGTRLVSGSTDGTIRIWDPNERTELGRLEGHTGGVRSVGWSPDGTRLVSGSGDGTIRVWDPDERTELGRLEGHTGEVLSVGWSPDGTRLVSGSNDGTIRVWDPDERTELGRLEGHTDRVRSVGWSPDGTRLVSGSNDGTIRVWDPDERTELGRLEGHTDWVRSVGWSPDGTRLVSGSDDGTIRAWDAQTNEEVWRMVLLPPARDGVTQSAGFDGDGNLLSCTQNTWPALVWVAANDRGLRGYPVENVAPELVSLLPG
ncbi:MAG: NACHT domain-containing protein [Candidatus Microthrix sp.]|nr:NACHT domain-containing protein [Candidatus Microthrix sp.]MBK7320983.1 NACHT domain-containing protein [Candidatus Microthrix sp.]